MRSNALTRPKVAIALGSVFAAAAVAFIPAAWAEDPPADTIPTQLVKHPAKGAKHFALTFDDGPDPNWTPKMLQVLKKHQVKATFCLTGTQAEAHPELVKTIVDAGHVLCNHSLKHDHLGGVSDQAALRKDLEDTSKAIRKAVPGVEIPYFRAPYGEWGQLPEVAAGMKMAPLDWAVDSNDWRYVNNPNGAPEMWKVMEPLVKGAEQTGAVILLHDAGHADRSQSVKVVDEFLMPYFKKNGWKQDFPARLGQEAPPPGGDDPTPSGSPTPSESASGSAPPSAPPSSAPSSPSEPSASENQPDPLAEGSTNLVRLPAKGANHYALTFDDGPHPDWTPKVLKVLDDHRVKATFCVTGTQAKAHPELVKQIHKAGHLLCNHSLKHDHLGEADAATIRQDLQATNKAIRKAVPGVEIPYFRAPYGEWGKTAEVAREMKMAPLDWLVDSNDWRYVDNPHGGPVLFLNNRPLLDQAQGSGAVVLLHDGGHEDRSATLRFLEQFLLPHFEQFNWEHDFPALDSTKNMQRLS